MGKHELWELQELQALPLDIKIKKTKLRIREWVEAFGIDGVVISFSGGKDSTVLLDIARKMYPCKYDDDGKYIEETGIKALFVDTGLEYPEIREFVKRFENVEWLRPKKTFKQVINEYGYPFISKEVSGMVAETRSWLDRHDLTFQNLVDRQTDRQTDRQIVEPEQMRCAPQIADFLGIDRRGEAKNSEEYNLLKKGTIPKIPIRTQFLLGVGLNPHTQELSPYNKKKWAFLVDSPYLISNKCCSVMKKSPAHEFQRKTKRKPITAQTAEESQLRQSQWLKNGCNGFDMKSPISNPMSFWTEQDILHYIKENNLEICSVYGDIVLEEAIWGDNGEIQSTIADMFREYNGQILKTTGLKRTGCMFCGYGCHLEKSEGRFERMKKTHPAQYDYIMRPKDKGGLDYKAVIDWLNENGGLNIRY